MKRVVIYFLLSMMMGAAMAQFPGGGFGPGGGRPMGDRPNMQQTTQKTYKGKTYSITGTLIDKTTKETLFYVNVDGYETAKSNGSRTCGMRTRKHRRVQQGRADRYIGDRDYTREVYRCARDGQRVCDDIDNARLRLCRRY